MKKKKEKVSEAGSWLKRKHALLLSSLTSVGLMPPVKFGWSNKESTTGSFHPVTQERKATFRSAPWFALCTYAIDRWELSAGSTTV